MNPVNDSLTALKTFLDRIEDQGSRGAFPLPLIQEARGALFNLTTALSSNQPLASVAECFCSEVEAMTQFRAAINSGGQRVTPSMTGLARAPHNVARQLEQYARDFRAAMEKKPDICRCPTNHHGAMCPLEP